MLVNSDVVVAVLEVIKLRKILESGKDEDGRRVTDGNLVVACIKEAEQKVGKLLVDQALSERPTKSNG